jgi:hypothetical protein
MTQWKACRIRELRARTLDLFAICCLGGEGAKICTAHVKSYPVRVARRRVLLLFVGKETLVTQCGNPKGIFGGKTIVPIVSDSKTVKSENTKGIFWGAGANTKNPKDACGANT